MRAECDAPLHPQAADGIRLFNEGHYFGAHEALEAAWNAERGRIRDLYRGVLQVAVVYLHVTRANYAGAMKVYERSRKWLRDWPAVCRGVHVGQLRRDLDEVIRSLTADGPNEAHRFDSSRLKPVRWEEGGAGPSRYRCDRCGSEMHEWNCEIICANCGNRFDCSDLTLHFD